MSKYELDGYVPLRAWERGVSYLVFIALAVATWQATATDAPKLRIALLAFALILAYSCAIIAFWDARVTARLRRKGVRPLPLAARGFAPAPFPFTERDAEWRFFEDAQPTTV